MAHRHFLLRRAAASLDRPIEAQVLEFTSQGGGNPRFRNQIHVVL
jgi:hypothetical protein